MPKPNDLSRSPVALEQDSTLIAVIEMSQSSWLVSAMVPGLSREPLKKLDAVAGLLLLQLQRWREEAQAAGHAITRLAVAFEAGRDGFWLARWLRAQGIEAHVIHASSVAVSRTHRRAKTDRLDTKMLKRAFLGWLRGEAGHCTMAAIPSQAEEDARRPSREREALVGERTRIRNRMKALLACLGIRGFNPVLRKAPEQLEALRTPEGTPLPPNAHAKLQRDMARLQLVKQQIREIEAQRLAQLAQAKTDRRCAMIRRLASVHGLGLETADLLTSEVFLRNLRDRHALARYAGLTGSPDESGKRRREQGLARAGNARVRTAMIQLAWRFLSYQKDSALAQWYCQRTEALGGKPRTARKVMIVALARKLLITLWRMLTTGEIPQGLVLKPAA